MTRSKKIFISVMIVFFIGLVFLAYDIGRKTTFPGKRPKTTDSISSKDTVKSAPSPKMSTHQP